MKTPINPFKLALRNRQAQIGFWLSLASPYSAEICAGAGFDWLLIDGEHAPNDIPSVLAQLQAIDAANYARDPAATPSHAIARIPVGHGNVGTALVKQYLDIGVQTLLVPMVDTVEQTQDLVRAMRYPPHGIRGMAGVRAARWGKYPNYGLEANEQVCLLVQAETTTAIENLDAIAAVEGVDGVFIGPADLSASMGYVGQGQHPVVVKTIEDAIRRIVAAGKAPGILAPDETLARHYLSLGATFVAVGLDNSVLNRGAAALAAKFKSAPSSDAPATKPVGTYG